MNTRRRFGFGADMSTEDYIANLRAAGIPVPPELLQIAASTPQAVGRVIVVSAEQQTELGNLEARGMRIAASDSLVTARMLLVPSPAYRRGFAVGTGVANGKSGSGPGQELIRTHLYGILPAGEREVARQGFDDGAMLQYQFARDRGAACVADVSAARAKQLSDLQARGRQIAASNAVVTSVRSGQSDLNWLLGFDIGTAVCQGTTTPGPGQESARRDASYQAGTVAAPKVGAGFDVAQALQHGIAKTGAAGIGLSSNPDVAAGQATIHGIAGSTISSDQKAKIAGTVANGSAGARAGAAATLPVVSPGIFRRILNWIEGK